MDLILVGDDGGNVNIFKMRRKFLVDNSSENEFNDFLTQQFLIKRDSFEKYHIMMMSVSFLDNNFRGNVILIGFYKYDILRK